MKILVTKSYPALIERINKERYKNKMYTSIKDLVEPKIDKGGVLNTVAIFSSLQMSSKI